VSASSPNPLCMGVCDECMCVFTVNLQDGPAVKQGSLRSGLGYQAGRGSMLVFEGTCECGVPVG